MPERGGYDVVVVGAGPAGSTTALFLAQAGFSVLLLEEHPMIGEPLICAEGVEQAGLKKFFSPQPNWIAAEVNGAVFRTPDNRSFRVWSTGIGYILERKAFDRDLAAQAARAGAEVRIGVRAIGRDDQRLLVRSQAGIERIGFQVLIGADGVASRVGGWFGLDTRLKRDEMYACAQSYLAGVDMEESMVEFILGPDYAPGGYAWAFPKGPGCANIGVGIVPGLGIHSPAWYLERLINWRFPKAQSLARMAGAVPIRPLRRFSSNNLILVGDAARLTDPISGAGIINAIHSARCAAEVVAQVLKDDDPSRARLDHYDALLKAELVKELSFRKKVHNIYKKFSPDDFIALMDFGLEQMAGRELSEINLSAIVLQIIRSGPRFWRLARELL
jgi:digeranylgeranylglycerophospholipid reductase